MTEEQGEIIIELLGDMRNRLDEIDKKLMEIKIDHDYGEDLIDIKYNILEVVDAISLNE